MINADARQGCAIMAPIGNGRQPPSGKVSHVTEWIGPGASLAVIMTAWRHVEKMMNYTCFDEGIPARIPVHTPWITRAIGKNLEALGFRMEPCQSCVHDDLGSIGMIGIPPIFAMRQWGMTVHQLRSETPLPDRDAATKWCRLTMQPMAVRSPERPRVASRTPLRQAHSPGVGERAVGAVPGPRRRGRGRQCRRRDARCSARRPPGVRG